MAFLQRGGRRSLFLAMALVTFLGLGVPALLIGGFVAGVRAPELARQQQAQDMASRLEVLANSLPYLMWTFDDTAIADVVQAMMRSPDVVRVVITDADARGVLADVSRPPPAGAAVHEGQRDILFRGKLIGHVSLAMDDQLARAALRQQRLFYVVTVGGQVLVSLALILVLLNSRIARPLRALGAFADDLAEGRFEARLAPPRHRDEIARLGGRLEHMRQALQRLFGEQASLLRRLRAEEARTLRQTRFYEAVSRSNRLIVRQHDTALLDAEICRICVETGHASMACVWSLRASSGQVSLVASAGQAPRLPPDGLPALLSGPDLAPLPGLFDGRVVVCNELGEPGEPGQADAAQPPGLRALAALPIRHGGQVEALLVLYAGEAGVFDDSVVALLDEMVGDLSFALDNADREAARQQAVQAVEAGYARFQRVFGAMPLPAAIHAADDGRIMEVNEATCEFHGLSRAQMVGRRWESLGVGLAPAELQRLGEQVEAMGVVRNAETRTCVRTGQWRDVLFQGERIEFAGRECILTITVDITERKAMESALRDSAARIAGIIETAMDAIVAVDGRLRLVVFNRAAERLFGVPAEQALGHTLERFIPARLRDRHAAFMRAFASDDQPARLMALKSLAPGADIAMERTTRARRLTALRADGTEFPIEASISRSGEGERLMLMAAVRDISGELEAERALQAGLAAEAASRAKTDFLSRMSHELRTPLNAILGFSQLLQADRREPLSERQRGQVDLIRQAGMHLLALINDVLDVSRIEAGQLSVDSTALPLRELLDEVLPLVQPLSERHAVTLAPDYRQGAERQVLGDAVRLRQVLLNVIGNAIKYNQHGGAVHIDVLPGVRAGQVCIQVEDTGIGMTADQLGHLYEPFNRLGREHGNIEGTGIGMALTKQLVDLMKGRLEVHSTVGAGTVVRIHMPCPLDDAAAASATPLSGTAVASLSDPAQARTGTVLCIEDNPVNAVIVQQLLGRWPGVSFHHAASGREGLELALRLQPDLVLLDMQLPDLDGMEVLAMLKADPRTRALNVVMLSGRAMAEDVEAALRSGARAYWTQPLDFARFIGDVQDLLPAAPPRA